MIVILHSSASEFGLKGRSVDNDMLLGYFKSRSCAECVWLGKENNEKHARWCSHCHLQNLAREWEIRNTFRIPSPPRLCLCERTGGEPNVVTFKSCGGTLKFRRYRTLSSRASDPPRLWPPNVIRRFRATLSCTATFMLSYNLSAILAAPAHDIPSCVRPWPAAGQKFWIFVHFLLLNEPWNIPGKLVQCQSACALADGFKTYCLPFYH